MQRYYCLIPRAQRSVISSERSPSSNQHPHVNHSIGSEFLPLPPSAQGGWQSTFELNNLPPLLGNTHTISSQPFVTQSLVKIT